MSLRRAKSADEYIRWVQEAVFEVGDLKDCMLYEAEEMQNFPAWIAPLEEGVKTVHQSMKDGNYSFGREDLSFMEVAYQHEGDIPFHTLLKQINETHKKGLEIEEDE